MDKDAYIFDFVLKAWTYIRDIITPVDGTTHSNFALDADQNLFTISGTTSMFTTYQTSSQDTQALIYKTKDIDFGSPGKVKKAYGGRVQFQDGLSQEFCMTEGAKVIQEKRIDSPAQKANFNKMMKIASVGKNMALLKDVLGPYGVGS